MKERVIFYIRYILFWLTVFIFFRLVFTFYHLGKAEEIKVIDILLANWHGLKLDFSLLGYFLILIHVFIIPLSLLKGSTIYKVINIYTSILLLLIIFLYIVDVELYNYWGFRLDDTFLDYLSTPKEMMANLTFWQILLLVFLIALLYVPLKKYYLKKWVLKPVNKSMNRNWYSSVLFLIVLPALMLPIRGGIDVAPLNTGSVYFHKTIFYNHAAINPVWNLLYTLTEKDKLEHSVQFFDQEKTEQIIHQIYTTKGISNSVLKTNNPNIVILILESFGSNVINKSILNKSITPHFNKYIKEGIYFSNFYATGTLSDRGIAGILAGYPALPKTTILHYENKSQNIPSLSKNLGNNGYYSRFFYGGDIDFAHIKSFLINSKFDKIIEEKDFGVDYSHTKWGIPDHIVFDSLYTSTNQASHPFFHVLFTLSSHEPFDVPMKPVFEGKDRVSKFYNSIHYTDRCLGGFIEKAKNASWWDNSLIILVADHGNRIENITHYDKNRFHIPMLWLGGALQVADTIVSKYGSQTDIAKTLLNQININSNNYIFSKDLLNENSKSFSYYSCQDGFGYINDSCYLVYDLTNNAFIETSTKADELSEDIGKAYLQYLLNDFSKR